MPRGLLLITVFVVSLMGWLLWSFPAAPLLQRVDGMMVAGNALHVSNVQGRVWDGGARWRWQQWRGQLDWRVVRQGWRPALQLDLRSAELRVSGRISAGRDFIHLRDLDLRVPLAQISRDFPQGSATGLVEGRVDQLRWQRHGSVRASGSFTYSGGEVSWPPDGSAQVPALEGRLSEDGDSARLQVSAPDGQAVMAARLTGEQAELRVFRAWPRLLGVSQGGRDEDVVFQVSERLVETTP